MRLYELHGRRDIRASEGPRPIPGADQVLLKVRCTGICGSDILYYKHGRCGSFVPSGPLVLGHEFCGEVVERGGAQEALPLEVRVAVDPSDNCGGCRYCLSGAINHCEKMRYFGSAACFPNQPGSHVEYIAVRGDRCHIVDEQVSDQEAALVEPLAIALNGVKQAGEVRGAKVLICGAGTIGQMVGRVCRHQVAGRIEVSDIRDEALKLATDTWADRAIRADLPGEFGNGYDVVIEASGAAAALHKAYEVCAVQGTLVQIGTYEGDVAVPAGSVMKKELTIRGSFRFPDCFAEASRLVAEKRMDMKSLITHDFAFDDLPGAFERACQRDAVKVTISY